LEKHVLGKITCVASKVAFKDQFKLAFLVFKKTAYAIFYVPCDVSINTMLIDDANYNISCSVIRVSPLLVTSLNYTPLEYKECLQLRKRNLMTHLAYLN
jgi:hypothetical protein